MAEKKLVANSLALISNRIVQSATSFIVLALIARSLGSFALGQYTLAFSYYFVFMTLVSSGFKTLFTRELSQKSSEISSYLISGTSLQLLFSIIGYILLFLVVHFMPYTSTTENICYVIGLAIIPFSLSNIVEAIFQAQEKMHWIAICTIPVYIVRTIIIYLGLISGYGIILTSGIFVISESIIFLFEWYLIQKFNQFRWTIDKGFIQKTIKLARTFLAIDGISVFRERMEIFIISLFSNESTIGLYGSVMQLMQPFSIVSDSIVLAAFPKMSKMSSSSSKSKKELAERAIELLLLLAIPMFFGTLFFSRHLLLFIYQDLDFADASIALCIISFGMVTRAFNKPLSYTLVANHLEQINLKEVLYGTAFGGLISVIFVSQFQLEGAAVSTIFVKLFGIWVYTYATFKRLFHLNFWRVVKRPLLVGGLMALLFTALNTAKVDFFSTLTISILVYSLVIFLMAFQSLELSNQLFSKLLRK
ncbi:oligosaccharide flippase family protein [Acaryochloris sp. CCMEE 5410]|uniref:oligosaccharide flippase family protein n=1 Tax=Acaryochloris sp. CCMEE 5410 TaxID=310037 RepID=UPI0002483CB3|nr:oligosaccharide flippase family protein [Acaryochloris sp. CCMEE 5410]KAI9132692.1 oligosaccharide flippase family protein [Acaryochloris sp. CCMEE 5410]